MKTVTLLAILACIISCVVAVRRGAGAAAPVGDIVQTILAALNKSVDPCSDFYAYSCGGWIANTVLSPDEDAVFKSITTIEDGNSAKLRSILETEYNGTLQVDNRLTTLYESCMNTTAIEEKGSGFILRDKQIIDTIQTLDGVLLAAGVLQREFGAAPLFGFGPTLDSKNPNMTIAQFTQGGIALPDPDLYQNAKIMPAYLRHVTNMFVLGGASNDSAAVMAKSVIVFESQIAAGTTDQDQLQNPFVTYNKIDLSGLQKLAPQINWQMFFQGIEHPNITQINVDVPSFYKNLQTAVLAQSLDTLRNYLWWNYLHAVADRLPKAFVQENFSFFGKVLRGLDAMPPRWETCIKVVDGQMGMLLGKYYVQVAFPGDSETKVSEMVHSIESQMHNNLENLPWMDNTTRANALLKLSEVSNDIGYPEHFFTYQGLSVTPNEYFNNVKAGIIWNFDFQADQIEKPTDKELWEMTPSTVNAYYDPTKNGMVFPAGILQSPFFDLSFSEPIYFGGSGVIMGHELTHGFDDSGRNYDGQGVLRNWWKPATSQKFDELTSCVINQYSKFEVLPGLYINGNLTQGENIADMGGTKLSYLALQAAIGKDGMKKPSVVPGMTNEQLFFVAYAQGWCAVQTPENLRLRVATDVHSTAKFRVLGPLINHPTFAEVYNCPVGSFMNPENKCAVW